MNDAHRQGEIIHKTRLANEAGDWSNLSSGRKQKPGLKGYAGLCGYVTIQVYLNPNACNGGVR
ncbi:hypothetical protein PanWU01x14_048580 [Parasponia andersonii]|uniref:Uncharacterized protein n=1 Tax=Parasponia andersonii TaxID=3476 RepID=A0A2P5DNB9_PARAD|nr:hypothetical protein PanWU01x14_048580 [Parasponia andersonii]